MLAELIRALSWRSARIVPQDCFSDGRWYREGWWYNNRRCEGGRWVGGMSRR